MMIKTGAPDTINLGIKDESKRRVPAQKETYAQGMAKVFIMGPKGPTEPMLLSGSKLPFTYGFEAFNKDSEYYNNATDILETVAEYSSVVVQRIPMPDAGVKSNKTYYLDVLSTDVPNYKRNSDGSLIPKGTSFEVDTAKATIPGVFVKVITEIDTAEKAIGLKTSKPGTMEEGGKRSTMYPIREVKGLYQGSGYNNIGETMVPLYKQNADGSMMKDNKCLTYNYFMYEREKPGAKPVIRKTLDEQPFIPFTFKRNAKDRVTRKTIELDKQINYHYFNTTDPLRMYEYPDIETYIYDDNIKMLLTQFMTVEKDHISRDIKQWEDGKSASTYSWFDYNTDDKEKIMEDIYLIEFLNCLSSKNVPYIAIQKSNKAPTLTGTQKEVGISGMIPIFLEGGSDGTISNENFEKGIVEKIDEYGDENSLVQDTAINLETIFYDHGLTLENKFRLYNFISIRKNTAIAFATFVASENRVLSLSEERSIGLSIRDRGKLYPESTFYGTPVARACIICGSGTKTNGDPKQRFSLVKDLAKKSSRMFSAGDGKWKMGEAFDHGEAAIVDELIDVEPKSVPKGSKDSFWDAGLTWPQTKNRSQHAITGIQSIYEDDTSVVNSWFNIIAVTTLTTIADENHREFNGAAFMSDSEFKEASERFLEKRVEGIFGTAIKVIPRVIITEFDKLAGFSWHLEFEMYGNVMKTKQIYTTRTFRSSDITA